MLIRLLFLALPLSALAWPHAQQDNELENDTEVDTSEVGGLPSGQIVPSSYTSTSLRGGLTGEGLISEVSEDLESGIDEETNDIASSNNVDSEVDDTESSTDQFAVPEISSVINVRDNDFLKIIGKTPTIEMAARRGKGRAAMSRVSAVAGLPDKHFAFEAGAWDPVRNEVWFTSNINIGYSTVHVLNLDSNVVGKPKLSQAVTNPNGGIYFDGKIYLCAFGNRTAPHGIYSVEPGSGVVTKIVDNYDGKPLNSPDDVAFISKVTADGQNRTSIFFTDPAYGALWGVSDQPQLRNGVYRYDFATRRIARVLGDDPITDPNGVCVDVTQTKVYVTNTPGTIQGRDIWVFNLDERWNLVNPQLFGTAEVGVPDGVKCDNFGNVWTGEGGGIVVRNARGKILGQFNAGPLTQGKSLFTKDMADFGLAGDTLVVLGLDVIWKIKLAIPVVTADRYRVGGLPRPTP